MEHYLLLGRLSARCYCGLLEDQLSINWERLGVVLFVVVVGNDFVVVVGLKRVWCFSESCWFGCRRRDDRGRGSHWLFQSAAHKAAFHGVPFQAVMCRAGPSRVVREIVVVSVNIGWLYV